MIGVCGRQPGPLQPWSTMRPGKGKVARQLLVTVDFLDSGLSHAGSGRGEA